MIISDVIGKITLIKDIEAIKTKTNLFKREVLITDHLSNTVSI